VPHVEAFWAEVLSDRKRHVVWFSRRVTRDYAGALEYLWRMGDRPCDFVDLTEASVPVRDAGGEIRGSRRAICTGLIEAYQFLDGNLFSLTAPVSSEARAAHRALWAKLRDENSPLRVVTPDLQLVSAPLTHFDERLLKEVQTRFLKAARIVGRAMMEKWDQGIIDVDDFFLAHRLMALSREGAIESTGDLRRITHSEVRLPQSGSRHT